MGLKRKIFRFISNLTIQSLRLNRATKLTCNLAEQISPIYKVKHKGKEYFFYCPNELTRWRAETMFIKEPETIEWIDSFKKDEILFDVGANIGLYSIYAAKRGVNVIAFEPESQNYALINKNLYLNKASDQITCLNIALSDRDSLDYLYLSIFQPGGALNNFGEALDWKHDNFAPIFKQGVISYSLDSFLLRFQEYFPTHIKIDVDGLEGKIIKGAKKTLRDSRLKSLLVEINESLPEDLEIVQFIESLGLKYLKKKHSQIVEDEEFKNVYNYIFVR